MNQPSIQRTRAVLQLSRSPAGVAFLAWKYRHIDHHFLRVSSATFPVVAYAADADRAASSLDPSHATSVLSPLDTTEVRREDCVAHDDGYLRLRQDQQAAFADNLTYVMRGIETEPHLRLLCQLGRYADGVATCDSLEWELCRALARQRVPSKITEAWFAALDRQLTNRNKLHRQVTDPVHDGQRRSAFVGCETLFVFATKKDGGYRAFIRKRSLTTLVEPDAFDVIPSCTFQPATADEREEFDLRYSFYREYLEELFSKPTSERQHCQAILGHPYVQELRTWEEQGVAQHFFTGLAVSLHNLRPECCTLYIVHTPEWWEKYGHHLLFNEEYVEQRGHRDILLDTLDEATLLARHPELSSALMVPSGAAAFWLGIRLLQAVEGAQQTLSKGVVASPVETVARDATAGKHAISVALLINGQHTPLRKCRHEELHELRAQRSQYELFVDELSYEYWVAGERHDIAELGGPQAALLWLVLTNVGGWVRHAELRRHYPNRVPETVHKDRQRLGERLGHRGKELVRKLLRAESRRERWRVPDAGWSFCWILRTVDGGESWRAENGSKLLLSSGQ